MTLFPNVSASGRVVSGPQLSQLVAVLILSMTITDTSVANTGSLVLQFGCNTKLKLEVWLPPLFIKKAPQSEASSRLCSSASLILNLFFGTSTLNGFWGPSNPLSLQHLLPSPLARLS